MDEKTLNANPNAILAFQSYLENFDKNIAKKFSALIDMYSYGDNRHYLPDQDAHLLFVHKMAGTANGTKFLAEFKRFILELKKFIDDTYAEVNEQIDILLDALGTTPTPEAPTPSKPLWFERNPFINFIFKYIFFGWIWMRWF